MPPHVSCTCIYPHHRTFRDHAALQAVPKLTRVRLARHPWSAAEQQAFKELIARQGFYRLRVPANVFSPEGARYVGTAVLASCLADAKFNEHFDLHVDTAGHIIALGYKTFVDCTKSSGKVVRSSHNVLTTIFWLRPPLS